ncbi:MAG: cyclic nucleotide-binding domain-containing protein [Gemmatimonadetes bacterium]|nr:cyclic nucleotide-binding domain-containing protein [Gemmatimonadota bacterium]
MDRSLFAESGIFKDLDDEEIEGVGEVCQTVEFKVGDYIFREGDEGDRLFIIEKGEVRISRHVAGAGEEAITVLRRGACFGEMSVLDSSQRSMDAIAHSRCTLITISREDFRGLLESNPELANKILWSTVLLLCERLRGANEARRSLMVMAMF